MADRVFQSAPVPGLLPGFCRCLAFESLVNVERLPEVLLGLAVVVADVAPAVSFQGPGFLEGSGQVSGDAETSGVVIARLNGVADPGEQLAETAQDLGLAGPSAAIAVDGEGLEVAGGSGLALR